MGSDTNSKTKTLEAMLAIASGLAVLYWFTDIRHFFNASILIGLIGLFFPGISKWIARGWFKLAEGLGLINGTILLTLIFLIILFPVAIISRLFNKLGIQLKKQNDKDSGYYTVREHEYEAQDLKNPW